MKSRSVIFETVSLFISYITVPIPSCIGLMGDSLFFGLVVFGLFSLLHQTFLYEFTSLNRGKLMVTILSILWRNGFFLFTLE
jgi:hypothetical protein